MSEVKIYELGVMIIARTRTDIGRLARGYVLHATSIASVGPDGYLMLHVQRE